MPTGLTRDSGWEIGVSRTLSHPIQVVWVLLVERPDLWLGAGATLPGGAKEEWTADGAAGGELRSLRNHDRIRLTAYRPDGDPTTIQVTVRDRSGSTAVTLHEEHLRDASERAERRTHWVGVMDRLAEALNA